MKYLNYVFVLLCVGFMASCASEKAQTLESGWYYIVKKDQLDLVEKIKINTQDTFYLNPVPVVTVPHFKEVIIYSGMVGNEGMQVIMNEEGTKLWADATKLYARNYMGFVIDNELVHVQRIASQNIYGTSTLNEKWFDTKYLEDTAAKLNLQIGQGQ
jgi:preprotein translocase subunit SecD